MVKEIKLTHSDHFTCEYLVNDVCISTGSKAKAHNFTLHPAPCNIKIKIYPHKIKPIVRIDGIMLNYGLAEITPWDHMLEFNLERNFFNRYFKKIVEAKKNYLQISEKEMRLKLGLDDHTSLVAEIEKELR